MSGMSKFNLRLAAGASVALLAFVSATSGVRASVADLSGGDAAGVETSSNLSLSPSTIVDAVSAYVVTAQAGTGPTTATVQGVLFPTGASNLSITGGAITYIGSQAAFGPTDTDETTDPTANDSALLNLIGDQTLFTPNTITATISNLTPGQTYKIDSLLSDVGFATRNETINYNGNATPAESFLVGGALGTNSSDIFNASNLVQAQANGQIVATYTSTTAGQGPVLNALAVSTIPEPATLGLIATGFGLLLLKRRRKLA